MKYMRLRTGYAFIGILALACMAIISLSAASQPDDVYLNINKGIDLFGRIYRELTLNYVDELDPIDVMHASIRGMLSSLDPYTVFIDKQDKGDVDMLTTGRYGGIGVTVGTREAKITIISLMEGYAAEREGLRVGDHIMAIDGKSVVNKATNEVRQFMRGDPGTVVRLTIERPGKTETFDVTLTRQEISLKNVTYADYIDDGIGYIKLERFSRRAGEDVREAIAKLTSGRQLTGLILDLRDNPGGLLDAAVDVVEKFVPHGSLIVSTRGRKSSSTKEYSSGEEPLLPHTPLILLVNGGSASASEIVAGAVQDLDRGLLIGVRTFGKGLVQNVTPLSYNASLKLTTSRYYTPSGRCIQEIDYTKTDSSASTLTKDSTKPVFKTLAFGRTVLGAGGIAPDSNVAAEKLPGYVADLLKRGLLFEFITEYSGTASLEKNSPVTPAMMENFKAFLASRTFEYHDQMVAQASDLIALAEREGSPEKILSNLRSIKKEIELTHRDDFSRHQEVLSRLLQVEIAARTGGSQGRIRIANRFDPQFKTAVAVFKTPGMYERLLHKPH